MYNVLKQALSDSNVNFIDNGNPPQKKNSWFTVVFYFKTTSVDDLVVKWLLALNRLQGIFKLIVHQLFLYV